MDRSELDDSDGEVDLGGLEFYRELDGGDRERDVLKGESDYLPSLSTATLPVSPTFSTHS